MLRFALLGLLALAACGPSERQILAMRCDSIYAIARSHSESLTVRTSCLSAEYSLRAKQAADDAAMMSSAAVGMGAAAAANAGARR